MDKDWKFHHIGLVVDDISKLEELTNLFGIGNFEKLSTIENGKSKDIKCILRLGDLTIDLYEEIPSIVNVSIDKKCQGLHHIAFQVNDINKDLKKLEDAGAQLLYETEYINESTQKANKLAFLAVQELGVVLEITQIN